MSNDTIPLTSWLFRPLAHTSPRWNPATSQLIIDLAALPPASPSAFLHSVPQVLALYLQVWLMLKDGGRHTVWRAALWPVAVLAILHGWFHGGRFVNAYDVQNNFAQGCGQVYMLVRSTAWAFTPYTPKRIRPAGQPAPPSRLPRDALSILISPRMIGWEGGEPYDEAAGRQPRGQLLRRHAKLALLHLLLVDFCLSGCQILFPSTMGNLRGGDIYAVADDLLGMALRLVGAAPPSSYPHLAVAFQQVFGMLSTAFTGLAIYATLTFGFHAVALFAIAAGQGAETWPSFMNEPWRSQSLIEFWGKRWHTLFKQAFIAPALLLPRRLKHLQRYVVPLGAFTISAAMHEFGSLTYSGCTSPHMRVGRFFLLCGAGALGELLSSRVTGRRVQGPWGALWMWTFLLCAGAPLARTWLQYGLGGVQLIPARASVFRGPYGMARRALQAK